MTQRLLGLGADVPLGTICAVEAGYRRFSPEQKARICRVLGIGESDARLVRELAGEAGA